MMRFVVMIVAICFCSVMSSGQNPRVVLVDSLTCNPLSNASVFNHKGEFIGTSGADGGISCASRADFPITLRYVGYSEQTIPAVAADTVFMVENIAELPEVTVESKNHRVLHILAYEREYSTLSSYTDTVTMFREKMVDYMIPNDNKVRFKGWRTPRVLNSKSYYRFTNASGLDSVSDRCSYHFSWSDWIGMFPLVNLPSRLMDVSEGRDTVAGKYTPAEIWSRRGDNLVVDINLLADSAGRRWVPEITYFLKNNNIDFEQFRLHLNFNNISGPDVSPLNLSGYSFNIESRGRGRDMFKFNRHDVPFFVTTYTEVYVLDKEFISVKEARKWNDGKFTAEHAAILEPEDAPELHPSTLALIRRVNSVNADATRLSFVPDHRLVGRGVSRRNFQIGHRALAILKQLTGITAIRSRRKFNKNWSEFRREQRRRNDSSSHSQ